MAAVRSAVEAEVSARAGAAAADFKTEIAALQGDLASADERVAAAEAARATAQQRAVTLRAELEEAKVRAVRAYVRALLCCVLY